MNRLRSPSVLALRCGDAETATPDPLGGDAGPRVPGGRSVRTRALHALAASALALALGVLVGGCAGGTPHTPPQPFGWETLLWRPCPAELPGAPAAECARLEVPLDWAEPEGDTIAVLTRRLRPAGDVRGRLWALDGGPGEPGDGLVSGGFADVVLAAGFELLVPTHRGAAYSTPLRCPNARDTASCVAELRATWGAGLEDFDTHQAARDVVALARAHGAADGGPTLIFGGSYGTVWLQRALQIDGGLFDGAYLDSAGDLGMSFERIGEWFEGAGRALLERCAEVDACSDRFPDGPAAAADRVLDNARRKAGCFASLAVDPSTLQRTLAAWLGGTDERAWIAPLLRRLDRCDEEDVAVLTRVFGRADEAPPPPTTGAYNPLLNLTVIYRGLYRVTMTRDEVAALAATLLFDNGAMQAHAETRVLFAPDFARAVDLEGLDYAGPMHVVQGALDPLTPRGLADAVATRWANASVDVVVLPESGHATPRFTLREDGERCSARWLRAFLAEPTRPVDRGCMDEVPSVDWGVTRADTLDGVEAVFGVRDAWGDELYTRRFNVGPGSFSPRRSSLVRRFHREGRGPRSALDARYH